jgi:DNA-binding MarR family transcriptional regulator
MASNMVLLELYSSLRRAISLEASATLRNTGFGLRQFIILRTLSQYPAVPVTELVDRTMTDAGTISRSIQQLAKDGYVEKIQCKKDGRISYVKLTKKGERMAPELDRLFGCLADQCFSKLKASEREYLSEILSSVVKNLERTHEVQKNEG